MRVEEAKRRAADQAPAARAGDGIDARLPLGERNAAGGDSGARRGEPGYGKLRAQPAKVREASQKSQKIHAIGRRSVAAHNLLRSKPREARDLQQIWAVISSVGDGHAD